MGKMARLAADADTMMRTDGGGVRAATLPGVAPAGAYERAKPRRRPGSGARITVMGLVGN